MLWILTALSLAFTTPATMPTPLQDTEMKIELKHTDGSVAPRYHRIYTVTIEDNQCQVKIFGGGNVLRDSTITLTPKQVKNLKKRCAAIMIDEPLVTRTDTLRPIVGSWTKNLVVNCAQGSSNESWNSAAKLNPVFKQLVDAIMKCVPFVEEMKNSTIEE